MELIQISKLIYQKIELLSRGRVIVRNRAEEKAAASASYDRVLALTIIKLKNGRITEFEGEVIENPQAGIMEKIAKGICWKEKLSCDKAEALYKAAITNMNALTTEICASQSLLKWESETEGRR